jgi:multidrug transporter EmrE-like cation transporter
MLPSVRQLDDDAATSVGLQSLVHLERRLRPPTVEGVHARSTMAPAINMADLPLKASPPPLPPQDPRTMGDGREQHKPRPSRQLVGVLLVLGASLCGAFRWAWTELLLRTNLASQRVELPGQGFPSNARSPTPSAAAPLNLTLATAPFGFAVLLPVALSMELSQLQTYMQYMSSQRDMACLLAHDGALAVGGGLLAFCMLLFELRVVQLASGLSLAIAGVFKELLTIACSVVFFGETLSRLNAIGLSLCTAGIFAYHRTKAQG